MYSQTPTALEIGFIARDGLEPMGKKWDFSINGEYPKKQEHFLSPAISGLQPVKTKRVVSNFLFLKWNIYGSSNDIFHKFYEHSPHELYSYTTSTSSRLINIE